jgi:hypothetical protein
MTNIFVGHQAIAIVGQGGYDQGHGDAALNW